MIANTMEPPGEEKHTAENRLARVSRPAFAGGDIYFGTARRHFRRVHELFDWIFCRRPGTGGHFGNTVTLPYGPEGKHGANYMQTMAASVAGMCGMAVLVQAMVWLGLPEPAFWKLVLYMMCIGMFGVGIGMLYTPLLVDRMQLSYPSGFAVANILRALTDKNLLKRSILKLGSGIGIGYLAGLGSLRIDMISNTGLSMGTIGAGMIVGARLAIPALVVGVTGYFLTPYLRSIHWLGPQETLFERLVSLFHWERFLGQRLYITIILTQALRRFKEQTNVEVKAGEDWKKVNTFQLVCVRFLGGAIIFVGNQFWGNRCIFWQSQLGWRLFSCS